MGHREFAAVERRAPEDQVLAPHLDPLFDPFDAPKPHQLAAARGVLHISREAALAPFAGISDSRHAGAELDERGRIFRDLGDAVDLRAVDVAERDMGQQIADGADAQLPVEEFGPCFAHAGHELDIAIQRVHLTKIRKTALADNPYFCALRRPPLFF